MIRTVILGLAAILITYPVESKVLYDNGSGNGTIQAFFISSGFAISNSFTLDKASNVTGVSFGGWTEPRSDWLTVNYAITATPASFPSGMARTVSIASAKTPTALSRFSFATYNFLTAPTTLEAGTYYLVLQNAVTSNGRDAYWDISNGASIAYANDVADLTDFIVPGTNSNSFRILGSAVPEPASWAMMIAGLGIVGAAARRRAKLTFVQA